MYINLTLLICLQCGDNDFGRDDVLQDVSYAQEKINDFCFFLR